MAENLRHLLRPELEFDAPTWDDTSWSLPHAQSALAALRAAHKARGLAPADAYCLLMEDSETDLLDVLRRVHEHGAWCEYDSVVRRLEEL